MRCLPLGLRSFVCFCGTGGFYCKLLFLCVSPISLACFSLANRTICWLSYHHMHIYNSSACASVWYLHTYHVAAASSSCDGHACSRSLPLTLDLSSRGIDYPALRPTFPFTWNGVLFCVGSTNLQDWHTRRVCPSLHHVSWNYWLAQLPHFWCRPSLVFRWQKGNRPDNVPCSLQTKKLSNLQAFGS